ncbi:MAG: cysteine-rich VLP domain-containing protein [Lachnospiraceae bacterium]|nr:cysteine-rich VLP domain-containing protein [Lachnospiraceae bacterium]
MAQTNRELTGREKQKIRKLVASHCANYDREYGCLPLDSSCYMFGICYTNSGLCKYFREALLPTEPELQAVFQPKPVRICKECGRGFPADGKRVYCSKGCAAETRRRQTAARVRKHRERKRADGP